jgi:hypothetical protein
MKDLWPFGIVLRGDDFKPPRAALAEDVVVSDRGKGTREVSGRDQEDERKRIADDVS